MKAVEFVMSGALLLAAFVAGLYVLQSLSLWIPASGGSNGTGAVPLAWAALLIFVAWRYLTQRASP